MSPEKGGALRTHDNRTGRAALALMFSAALVVLPLVLLAGPSTGTAARHRAAVGRSHATASARGLPLPPSELADFAAFIAPAAPPPPTTTTPAAPPPPTTTTPAAPPPPTTTTPATTPAATPTPTSTPAGTSTPAATPTPAGTSTPAATPTPTPAGTPTPAATPPASLTGGATWYSEAAPGTCASPTLPFGTTLEVVNDATGASTTCVVDDREASNPGRVVDMSPTGFSQIATPGLGVVTVTISW